MDRVTVYQGQLPRVEDILQLQQDAMVGLGTAAAAVFGTPTLVDGFTCTPTTPASLNVLLTAGSIYQLENLEATSWSALNADNSHSIVKQGILLDPVSFAITPPGTIGYSQVYIIEVQYQDFDTGSLVLPYYNASNPAQPYSGPANSGTAQNTARHGKVAYQTKAGVAATTGTQVTPTADAGWTALFAITVANGATTITSGNITQISTAPFLTTHGKLPLIPTGVQYSDWTYAADTGAANAYVVTLTPAPAQYSVGLRFSTKISATNTGASTINVNGLGNKSIVDKTGAALFPNMLPAGAIADLEYDGTNFQVIGLSNRKFPLNANTTIYVNASTGSDVTGTGTSGAPFKTLQFANDYAQQNLDLNKYQLTFNCTGAFTAGLYVAGIFQGQLGYGSVVWDLTAATITCANACIYANQNALITVNNGTLVSSGTGVTQGIGLLAGGSATTIAGSGWTFGACAVAHMYSYGSIYILGSYTINGASPYHFLCQPNATIVTSGSGTITVSGTPAFSGAFADCNGGEISISSSSYTFSGSATGSRYIIDNYGCILTIGSGSTYFPGNSAGTVVAGKYS